MIDDMKNDDNLEDSNLNDYNDSDDGLNNGIRADDPCVIKTE